MDIIEEQNVSAGVVKHSFFLNIEQAYVEAEKKNTVIDEDGNVILWVPFYKKRLYNAFYP